MATAKRKYSFGLISRLGFIAAFVGLGSWAVFNSQFKKKDGEEVAQNEGTEEGQTELEKEDKKNSDGSSDANHNQNEEKSNDEIIKDKLSKKASFVEKKKPKKIEIIKPDSEKKSNSGSFSFGSRNNNSGPPSSKSFSMDDLNKKKSPAKSNGFSPPSSKSFSNDSKSDRNKPGNTFNPTNVSADEDDSKKSKSGFASSKKEDSGGQFSFNPKSNSTDSSSSSSGPPSSHFNPAGSVKQGSGSFSVGDNNKKSDSSLAGKSGGPPSSSFNPSGTFSPGKNADSDSTSKNGPPSNNFNTQDSIASKPGNNKSASKGSGFQSKFSNGKEKPLRGDAGGVSKNSRSDNTFSLSGNSTNNSRRETENNNSFDSGGGNSGGSGSGFSFNNGNANNGSGSTRPAKFSSGNAFQDKGSKPLPKKSTPRSNGLIESKGKSDVGSNSSGFADVNKNGFSGDANKRPGTSLDPGTANNRTVPGSGARKNGPESSGGGFAGNNFSGNGSAGNGNVGNQENQKLGPNRAPQKQSFSSNNDAKPNPNLSGLPQGGVDDRKPGPSSLEGIQAPAVTLQKLSPREIQVNVESSFKLVVRNVGRANATNITVVDPIPDGMEFINAEPRPSDRGTDGSLIWKFGSLSPNEQKIITVNVLPKKQGELGSVARMSFQSAATAKSVCTKPELSLTHRGPQKVLRGQVAQFLVTVQNNGDGIARNVMIEDEVPPGFAFGDGKGSRLAYEVGNLPPGAKRDVVLKLRAVEPGRYVNEVRAKMGKTMTSNHKLNVEVVAPKLDIAIVGPTRRYIQREANYKIEVQNTGTASAKNILMVTRLPRGLKFISTNNQGQYNPREHAVYWSMVELSPQNKGLVELKVLPLGTGQQDIEFEARSLLDRTKLKKFPVVVDQLAELFFEVDDRDDPIEVNGETEYRVRVVNQGSKAATNVKINVQMPIGIEATTTHGPTKGNLSGQIVSFTPVASLAPRGELIYKIKARGTRDGDHLIKVMLSSNERREAVAKQESTKVYSEYK